jgi:hypothetical protein
LLSSDNVHTGYWAHPACYSMDSGVLSQSYSGRGVKLTTFHNSVTRLRISEVMSPYPYMSSWHEESQIYLLPEFHHKLISCFNTSRNFLVFPIISKLLSIQCYEFIPDLVLWYALFLTSATASCTLIF